jgi:hypothetical protein
MVSALPGAPRGATVISHVAQARGSNPEPEIEPGPERAADPGGNNYRVLWVTKT